MEYEERSYFATALYATPLYIFSSVFKDPSRAYSLFHESIQFVPLATSRSPDCEDYQHILGRSCSCFIPWGCRITSWGTPGIRIRAKCYQWPASRLSPWYSRWCGTISLTSGAIWFLMFRTWLTFIFHRPLNTIWSWHANRLTSKSPNKVEFVEGIK